ncbi:cache domain-containing sensor histidine kinase [Paenibacillus glycinis]|uniref:HAMP domain-containing protein n=1 Tax=Paenibacillus glycinis TaxID=2697035 RepID=A0ABW9XTV2_9BACL|nr:sensor histidine kinase [Paenibacillus glycinis]NBD25766.1 HAMP domain-containing protein [Paenibacillus glycinis]
MRIPHKLMRYYRRLPLRMKLLLWIFPLLLLPDIAIGEYSYHVAAKQVLSKMDESQKSLANETVSHLDYFSKDILDIYYYLYLSTELHTVLLNRDQDLDPNLTQNVFQSINRLMVTRQFFKSLAIYGINGKMVEFGNLPAVSYDDFMKTASYRTVFANAGQGTWDIQDAAAPIFLRSPSPRIIFARPYSDLVNLDLQGFVVIGIDETELRRSYASESPGVETLVTNNDGEIISDSQGRWIGQSIRQTPYYQSQAGRALKEVDWAPPSSSWLITHERSKLTGWHVIVVRPRSELIGQLKPIKSFTLLVIIGLLILAISCTWYISTWFTKPITQLLASMRKVQKGDFTQSISVVDEDELSQLNRGYNTMVRRVGQLIEEVYQVELKQKDSELKLLQSQINPHFLYNTLNSVSLFALQHGDHQVAQMIYALSTFFRMNLSGGKDLITLGEELQLVESYLFLQKIRFGDKIDYEVELDPAAADFPIPKLLIQPFVENAIVHGIEPLEEPGYIGISAEAEDGMLIIQVRDNGSGMTPERLSGIDDDPGYAIANIKERVRLHYGDEASIDIQSALGAGTIVRLKIRWRKERMEC